MSKLISFVKDNCPPDCDYFTVNAYYSLKYYKADPKVHWTGHGFLSDSNLRPVLELHIPVKIDDHERFNNTPVKRISEITLADRRTVGYEPPPENDPTIPLWNIALALLAVVAILTKVTS
jgi:hypothetical protein